MKKRKKKHNRIILLYTVAIFLLLFSSYGIYTWLQDKQQLKQVTQDLKSVEKKEATTEENILVNPPQNKDDSYWKYVTEPLLTVDFLELSEKNSDTVAWIKISGTTVDYPVVQTTNNEFYLTHSFEKQENKAGWIYGDFRNNWQSLNANTILYGHGRTDGTMFGSLNDLLNDDWYQNNKPLIQLSTPAFNLLLQIFSVYTIDKESYYLTTHFDNQEQFSFFLKTIKERSMFNFQTTVNDNDKIFTLSTCKDNFGKRIVVHAKIIKKETRSY